MRVLGIVGWKNSGKTRLVQSLLPEFIQRGLRVSTIKHAHHAFDLDRPGKDSHVHRMAGAHEVLIASGERWALLHENRDEPEPELDVLLTRLAPVDLVLVEGFKRHRHAKLEVHRPNGAGATPLLCRDDRSIIGLVTDEPVEPVPVPVLRPDAVGAIAGFVLDRVLA